MRNLFDPFMPLRNPNTWLRSPEEVPEEEFGNVAVALRRLLPWVPEDWLRRDRDVLEAEIHGARFALTELSAGYQTVIALALDVYASMRRRFKAMELAEGVVLCDEIGEHLHPRWKKRIVKDLRRVFPRVQFLATTHDPLCLRGVRGREVVLMRRTSKGEVHARSNLPRVEDMRIDQILTSEYFGLQSLFDDEADSLFKEYYGLLALSTWSVEQAKRLKELKLKVDEREVLGVTVRERMMLEAIDRYLAKESDAPDGPARRVLADALDVEISRAISAPAKS